MSPYAGWSLFFRGSIFKVDSFLKLNKMKYLLSLLMIFGTVASFAQVRPDNFTLVENPDTTNFELYSQKGGLTRRTTLDRMGKYVLSNLTKTYSDPNLIFSYFGVSDTIVITSAITKSFTNDTLYIADSSFYLGDYDNTLSFDTATQQLTLVRKGTNSVVSLATLTPSVSYNTSTYQLGVGDATADLTTLRQTLTYNSATRELTLSNSGGTVTLTGAGSDGNGIYSGGGTVPTGSITVSGTRNVSNVAQTDLLFRNYKTVELNAQLNSSNAENAKLILSNLTTGTPEALLETVNTRLQLKDSESGYAYVNLQNENSNMSLRMFDQLTDDYLILGDATAYLSLTIYDSDTDNSDYLRLLNTDVNYEVRLDSNVLRYMADYSADFVDRTLVDKGYVDAQIAANVGSGGISYDTLTSGFLKVYIVSFGLGANSFTLSTSTAGDYSLTIPTGAEIIKMSIYGNSTTLQGGGNFEFEINNNNNGMVYYPQIGMIDMSDGAVIDLYTSPDFAPDIDVVDRKTGITLVNVNGLANEFVVTIR